MPDQYILGLSAFYHDSAAALLKNGQIVAAASEERFSRKKADERFPTHAVDFCLRQAGITASQLTHVGFYDKPLLKFERILETFLGIVPRGFTQFRLAGPLWIKDKLYIVTSSGTLACLDVSEAAIVAASKWLLPQPDVPQR